LSAGHQDQPPSRTTGRCRSEVRRSVRASVRPHGRFIPDKSWLAAAAVVANMRRLRENVGRATYFLRQSINTAGSCCRRPCPARICRPAPHRPSGPAAALTTACFYVFCERSASISGSIATPAVAPPAPRSCSIHAFVHSGRSAHTLTELHICTSVG